MFIDLHVCTFAQAKLFKKLGVVSPSMFYHSEDDNNVVRVIHVKDAVDECRELVIESLNEKFEVKAGEFFEYDADGVDALVAESLTAFMEEEVVLPAYTVSEMATMIGKGTKAAEAYWQWLRDCVNAGLSGTVAYNAVALAGFVINQLEIGNLSPCDAVTRLGSEESQLPQTKK